MHRNKNMFLAMKVCRESFRKWMSEPRIWTAAFLAAFFAWIQIELVRGVCVEQNLAISNWYFPFLFSDTIYKLFFFFGILLLFCNAPFVDNQQMMVVLRSGKSNWFIGKILYIFFTSVCYFLWLFLVSVIEFFPYVGFSLRWESIIEGLSINGQVGEYRIPISRNIVLQLTPLRAFMMSYIICVLAGILLGLFIFYINMYGKTNLGVGVALCILLMTGIVDVLPLEYQRSFLWFSPISWTDVEVFTYEYGGVSFSYAIAFLMIINILLVVLIMQKAKSYNMEAMEEL